jgi:hypothetical protein
VEQRDAAGNLGPAASSTWTVDLTPPAAPTITAFPANPTNQTTAAFSFTGEAGASFLCSLDGAAFAACTSSKSYTGIAAGSHTFRVEARDAAGNTGSPAAYTWTVDLTAPTVSSINRADPSPANAGPLHWTVTFSESVNGVGAGNFGLVTGGLGGSAPTIASAAAVGSAPSASWTVTVSTSGTTGTNAGSIQLNLTSKSPIADMAGNALAGTPPIAGQAYTFDTTPPPAPSLTSTPANPTNQTSASFAFGDTEAGVTFACQVDVGVLAPCASPAGYAGLSDGSHTFTVQARDAAGNSSSRTSFTWTIDTVRPTVTAINLAGANPTAATSVAWAVTFSKPVTGVASGNFSLTAAGFTGTPTVTGVSGSGTTYTVTASTGSGTTTNTASLRLSLTSAGTIVDTAGNSLSGVPFAGQAYTVDRLAPPVAFTLTPPDPNSTATSNFAWTSSPPASDFDHYECSVENGPFSTTVQSPGGPNQPCATPLTYAVGTTNNGQHQFAVRAYDHLGNYTQINYSWKVAAGSIQDFTIDGNTVGLMYPGGAAVPIALTLHNPNNLPIYVTALTAAATMDTAGGCSHNDLVVVQPDLSTATTPGQITVPANGSVTLPAQNVAAPTIRLLDNGHDQTPACAGQTFGLSYSGSAHS